MTARNFSVGDVVVCVNTERHPYARYPMTLVQGRLYTVTDALWVEGSSGIDGAVFAGGAVRLFGVLCANATGAWDSRRFRLAYRPDPEVEREAVREPKRQGVDA